MLHCDKNRERASRGRCNTRTTASSAMMGNRRKALRKGPMLRFNLNRVSYLLVAAFKSSGPQRPGFRTTSFRIPPCSNRAPDRWLRPARHAALAAGRHARASPPAAAAAGRSTIRSQPGPTPDRRPVHAAGRSHRRLRRHAARPSRSSAGSPPYQAFSSNNSAVLPGAAERLRRHARAAREQRRGRHRRRRSYDPVTRPVRPAGASSTSSCGRAAASRLGSRSRHSTRSAARDVCSGADGQRASRSRPARRRAAAGPPGPLRRRARPVLDR